MTSGWTSGSNKPERIQRLGAAALAGFSALYAGAGLADPQPYQLNMTRGASTWSPTPYFLNNLSLGVCVVIGVLVFGTMFVAMFRFRKSRGVVAQKWSHHTMVEVVWTTIPVIILAVLAYLATGGLMSFSDTTGSQMTVKVTGYQWKWRYDYMEYQGKAVDNVGFMSKLDKQSNRTRQLDSGLDPFAVKVGKESTYLLDVDKPLVVPVDTKIRFVITSGDVIHSWWVPALGWKMDAIPGIVNAAWTNITRPGVYRGQCAELCGQDHAYMPIVVKAVPKAAFAQWLAQQKAVEAKRATPEPEPATEPLEAAPVATLGSEAAAAIAPGRKG